MMITENKRYLRFIKRHLGFLSNFINLGSIQVSNAVIQLILFRLIIGVTGLTEFGLIMVANTYAMLNALFINYGTNQSGIKEVAIHKSNKPQLSETFYTIFYARLLLLAVSVLVLVIIYQLHFPNARYFPYALTIILSETLSPFFFFVGIEKLLLYNLINLFSKILSALLIVLIITTKEQSVWVNFYLGVVTLSSNFFLCLYLIRKYELIHFRVPLQKMKIFFSKNFFLVGNNLSVQLQQSIFLFTLSASGNTFVLGAYSLCDKIVWAFRQIIIAFSSAVYPRSVIVFHENKGNWITMKKNLVLLLAAGFIIVAAGVFLFAPLVVKIFTGGMDPLAITYTKCICLVPLIAAINSMNVIDLLIKDKYHYIFIIGMILLGISALVSGCLLYINKTGIYGYYLLIIESFSLPLYLYFIRQSKKTPDVQ